MVSAGRQSMKSLHAAFALKHMASPQHLLCILGENTRFLAYESNINKSESQGNQTQSLSFGIFKGISINKLGRFLNISEKII